MVNADLLFTNMRQNKKSNLILVYFAIINIVLVVVSYPIVLSAYIMNE